MTETKGGKFIRGDIISIDPVNRTLTLSDGKTIEYDVVSFNTGSTMRRSFGSQENGIFDVKPIRNMEIIRDFIVSRCSGIPFKAAVIGGGLAGIECACSLKFLAKELKSEAVVSIIEAGSFLSSSPAGFRAAVMTELKRAGITIIEEAGESEFNGESLVFSKGEIKTDVIINASGVRPSDIFIKSGLEADGDGALIVNRYLQSPDYPDIFGAGDCISFSEFPLPKVGVYAVRQNSVIYNNLISYLNGTELIPFIPQKSFLKILNTGSDRGILFREPFIIRGRIPFIIKDFIDRRFMKRFRNF
jgi:NADH dehydrogenase FAD-containing subunit